MRAFTTKSKPISFSTNFAKYLLNAQLITVFQRTQMMQRLTAKEKYELMKEIAPVYEEVLPDYQYATVLGITPQSLSRIKRGL